MGALGERRQRLRYLLAFLAAPLPAASIQALIVAVRPRPHWGVFEHPASMFVTMCLLLYVLAIALGIPAFLFLRRSDPISLRTYAFTGAIMTSVPASLVAILGIALGKVRALEAGQAPIWYGLLGLLTGAAFWLIARPDRRAGIGRGRAGKAGLLKTFD